MSSLTVPLGVLFIICGSKSNEIHQRPYICKNASLLPSHWKFLLSTTFSICFWLENLMCPNFTKTFSQCIVLSSLYSHLLTNLKLLFVAKLRQLSLGNLQCLAVAFYVYCTCLAFLKRRYLQSNHLTWFHLIYPQLYVLIMTIS